LAIENVLIKQKFVDLPMALKGTADSHDEALWIRFSKGNITEYQIYNHIIKNNIIAPF
jgi:hypothetical protein